MENEKKGKLSPEDINKLWTDTNFSGSFSGLKNFQTALALEKNIHLDLKTIRNALLSNKQYLIHIQSRKRFPRRTYDYVHGYGKYVGKIFFNVKCAQLIVFLSSLFECDLAVMTLFDNWKYILVVVDVFSRKLFTRKLKKKDAESVRRALQNIFREANVVPNTIATDKGAEFRGNAQFFKESDIFFQEKRGLNKAAMAGKQTAIKYEINFFILFFIFPENFVKILKRRLYMTIRGQNTENWPAALEQVTKNINNRPLESIGYLKPSTIHSPIDDLR